VDGLPATPRSDLYAVGVVLYEGFTGLRPFTGATPVQVAYSIQHTIPPPLLQANPAVPPAVAAVVERAMSKDPASRPASAAEMAAALGVGEGNGTVQLTRHDGSDTVAIDAMAVRAMGPPRGPVRLTRRGVVTVAAVLAAVLILGVAVAAARHGGAAKAAAASASGAPKGDVALAAQIDDLSARVRQDDGAQGPALGERLHVLAGEVRAASPGTASDANGLLADAAAWRQQGDDTLSGPAYDQTVTLLTRITGVAPPVTTTTSTTVDPAAGARQRLKDWLKHKKDNGGD